MFDPKMNKTVFEKLPLKEKTLYCIPSYQMKGNLDTKDLKQLLIDLQHYVNRGVVQNYTLPLVILKEISLLPDIGEEFDRTQIVVDGQSLLTMLQLIYEALEISMNARFWDMEAKRFVEGDDLLLSNADTLQQARKLISQYLEKEGNRQRFHHLFAGKYANKAAVMAEYFIPKEATKILKNKIK